MGQKSIKRDRRYIRKEKQKALLAVKNEANKEMTEIIKNFMEGIQNYKLKNRVKIAWWIIRANKKKKLNLK